MNSKLSKSNFDKLDLDFLYKAIPSDFNKGNMGDPYWCKNWTFKVEKDEKSGKAWMCDTYFRDSFIEVTDDNIDKFEIVFDFREVKQIRDSEYDEYDEKDVYRVATNSGGYSCGGLYWINKDCKKSIDLIIEKKKYEIRSLERNLAWAKDDLEKLITEKNSR